MKTVTLAFDIERAGATNTENTIAIGASVVDENLNELDNIFIPGYFKGETKFEDRCWNEFWSKHEDKLEQLKYDGELTQYQREAEMVSQFLEFKLKWEDKAEEEGFRLEVVSDNNVYDGGFINEMIFEHTDCLPLPYTVRRKYAPFWETHSMQRGILMIIYPDYDGDTGFSERINRIYSIPESTVTHDHNPTHDAYTIAREHQVMLGIKARKYVLDMDELRKVKDEDAKLTNDDKTNPRERESIYQNTPIVDMSDPDVKDKIVKVIKQTDDACNIDYTVDVGADGGDVEVDF
jgi:hypothetical protein